MPANTQALGPGILTIGDAAAATDISCQISAARIAWEKDADDDTAVLCGDTVPGEIRYSATLGGTLFQDFSSATAIGQYTWENKGTQVPFTFVPSEGVGAAGDRHAHGRPDRLWWGRREGEDDVRLRVRGRRGSGPRALHPRGRRRARHARTRRGPIRPVPERRDPRSSPGGGNSGQLSSGSATTSSDFDRGARRRFPAALIVGATHAPRRSGRLAGSSPRVGHQDPRGRPGGRGRPSPTPARFIGAGPRPAISARNRFLTDAAKATEPTWTAMYLREIDRQLAESEGSMTDVTDRPGTDQHVQTPDSPYVVVRTFGDQFDPVDVDTNRGGRPAITATGSRYELRGAPVRDGPRCPRGRRVHDVALCGVGCAARPR